MAKTGGGPAFPGALEAAHLAGLAREIREASIDCGDGMAIPRLPGRMTAAMLAERERDDGRGAAMTRRNHEMTEREPITWGDIARMLVYSDQGAALEAANAAMAEALPGYEWHIVEDADDPLDRSGLGLEARPGSAARGEGLCPEGVRDAVWGRDPDAPDPVTPLVKAYRSHRAALAAGAGRGEISDGYHSFNELYEHRHALFLALARALPGRAWASRLHADGTRLEGWFVAGMTLGGAQITYHLPDRLWPVAEALGIVTGDPPAFDGHSADDVVRRLMAWVRSGGVA